MAERKPVAPEMWRRIFQDDPDGAAILEELAMEHVYAEPFVAGAPDATAFNLGARAVVMKILQRCGQ